MSFNRAALSPGIGGQRNFNPVFSGKVSMGDIEAYNKEVSDWAKKVINELKASARSLTRDGKTSARMRKDKDGKVFKETILSRDIRYSIGRFAGEIERVGFSFPRHGVFWQKGVSRNRGVGNERTAFDWFNSVIERNIPALEDIAAKYYAQSAVNATRMLIN